MTTTTTLLIKCWHQKQDRVNPLRSIYISPPQYRWDLPSLHLCFVRIQKAASQSVISQVGLEKCKWISLPGLFGQLFELVQSAVASSFCISILSSIIDSLISFTPAFLGKASLCVLHSCLTFMFPWEKATVQVQRSAARFQELVDCVCCGCEDGEKKKKVLQKSDEQISALISSGVPVPALDLLQSLNCTA